MAILHEYHCPTSLAEALRLIDAPDRRRRLLAGGTTLVGALETRAVRDVDGVVDLRRLGLDTMRVEEETIHIGAMTTLTDLATHPATRDLAGGLLPRAVRGEGPVNLRNQATVGGVIATAAGVTYAARSPISAPSTASSPTCACLGATDAADWPGWRARRRTAPSSPPSPCWMTPAPELRSVAWPRVPSWTAPRSTRPTTYAARPNTGLLLQGSCVRAPRMKQEKRTSYHDHRTGTDAGSTAALCCLRSETTSHE